MGRGGTPVTVVWGRGGKWNGIRTGAEGTPPGGRLWGGGAGVVAGRAGGEWAARATARAKGRVSPPGLDDTPAGSISAPAARLSPPLDPARCRGWAFCGREGAQCRGSSRLAAGAGGSGAARA